MQSVPADFTTAINQSSALYTLPKLVADFNMNVCATIATVGNLGDDIGGDPDYYPISSIAQGHRPGAGMPKAKIGETILNDTFSILGEDMIYKYWSSNNVSTIFNVGGGYGIEGIQPYILYSNLVPCNKIQIGFENSISSPESFQILITTDGTTWTEVVDTPTIDINGRAIVYLQDDDSWNELESLNNSIQILGVQVFVEAMDHGNVVCNVIEVSACLKKDLSADIVDMSVTKSITEPSLTQPFGLISDNVLAVTLDNSQKTYINNNVDSPLFGLLENSVQLTAFFGVNPDGFDKIDVEYVQQGIFYVDTWGDEAALNASVSATDYTRFLQQQSLLPTLWTNKDAGHIIKSILNIIGFNNFKYFNEDVKDYRVPYFWVNNTDIAINVINDLCNATQSFIYFDEFENCVYVKRNDMTTVPGVSSENQYPPPSPYDFTTDSYILTSEMITVLGEPLEPNIIDMSHEYDTQVNQMIVNYKDIAVNKDVYGRPLQTSVWVPSDSLNATTTVDGLTTTSTLSSDDISIMSGLLTQDMNNTQLFCWLDPTKAALFEFAGYLNIDGEVMQYDGKEYAYYAGTGSTVTKVLVHNQDDVNNINNNLTSFIHIGHNYFTGKFNLLTRGDWGTTSKSHLIVIGDWSGFRVNLLSGPTVDNTSLIKQYKSTLTLKGTTKVEKDLHVAQYTGPTLNSNYIAMGTQMMFPQKTMLKTSTPIQITDPVTGKPIGTPVTTTTKVARNNSGGIFLNLADDWTDGIFIDIQSTDYSEKVKSKEITAFTIGDVGPLLDSQIPLTTGGTMLIAPDIWYTVDVTIEKVQGSGPQNYIYSVYINSKLIMSFENNTAPQTTNWGLWARGDATIRFEYVYVVSSDNASTAYEPALYGILDRIDGSYISNALSANILYKKKQKSPKWKEWIAPYFDDFGPYAHEIRPFTVQYDTVPVLGAQMYYSNDKYLDLIDFNANSFGASFYMANKNRDQIGTSGAAIMQGSDPEEFGANNPIPQSAFIFGQVPTDSGQLTLTINNQTSINNTGLNSLTIDSDWIQTDSEARDLATWTTTYWAKPIETLSGDVWINPATQLLDSVYINYPLKNIAGSYYMTQIQIGWEGAGLTGNVTVQASLI